MDSFPESDEMNDRNRQKSGAKALFSVRKSVYLHRLSKKTEKPKRAEGI